ncbi:hypothetical protein NC653_029346 [Populus alba x Populus x berolinensis]|uniref:Uncharacterized protein n=1 Tax=Populus alba x Populus x berolinensis TaxID=444605 RepID=A0AAD6Q390_9ROSI|nr:hypothetical protein NC653_029346 [Populus alba x Populus x berolinensis]
MLKNCTNILDLKTKGYQDIDQMKDMATKTKSAHPYLKLDKSHKFLTQEWKLSNTLRNRRVPWITNFSIIPSAVKMKQPSNYHKIRLYLYDKYAKNIKPSFSSHLMFLRPSSHVSKSELSPKAVEEMQMLLPRTYFQREQGTDKSRPHIMFSKDSKKGNKEKQEKEHRDMQFA